MRDDISDIAAHYDANAEIEDARLKRHQLEYDLTWCYLNRYLPPAGCVLEIGAATGVYTLPLCQRGHTVTAVDLSPVLLERCARRLAAAGVEGRAQFVVADVRDLPAVLGAPFDAVLLMGPLYHLVYEADRREAVRQAAARLRSGGVLISAHLSRLGVLGYMMKRTPEWIERETEVRFLIEQGRRPDDAPRGGFRGYFARVEEIGPLHEACGLRTEVLAGVEPAISADDESYNVLDASRRERWLDLLFAVSAEAATLGASRHLLYIGRKIGGDTAAAV